jgi:SAM-dependent methyltransferase
MSRKYLNDKWCIRCGRKTPSPYLKNNVKLLPKEGKVLDIGCGNGRNSIFMKEKGYVVTSVDMVEDFGNKNIIGEDPLPSDKYDIILDNYILMFLDKKERKQVI